MTALEDLLIGSKIYGFRRSMYISKILVLGEVQTWTGLYVLTRGSFSMSLPRIISLQQKGLRRRFVPVPQNEKLLLGPTPVHVARLRTVLFLYERSISTWTPYPSQLRFRSNWWTRRLGWSSRRSSVVITSSAKLLWS